MIETSCAGKKRKRNKKMKSIKRLAAAVLAFVMLFTAAVGMTTAAAEGAAIPSAAAKTFPRNLPHRCFIRFFPPPRPKTCRKRSGHMPNAAFFKIRPKKSRSTVERNRAGYYNMV